MPHNRRQARILAMQALSQWEAQRDESPEVLEEFFTAQGASRSAARHATRVVETFWLRRDEIDERIASASHRWDLSRISTVERNILRVAIVEMEGGAVPPKVAIDEAVEIGGEFGGTDSPKFINGVLDAIYRRMHRTQDDVD